MLATNEADQGLREEVLSLVMTAKAHMINCFKKMSNLIRVMVEVQEISKRLHHIEKNKMLETALKANNHTGEDKDQIISKMMSSKANAKSMTIVMILVISRHFSHCLLSYHKSQKAKIWIKCLL